MKKYILLTLILCLSVSLPMQAQLFGGHIKTPVGNINCDGEPAVFTYNGLQYRPIKIGDQCWLDRDLGASRVAQSSTDFEAYGDLFQWGRSSDGHESINWTSSTTSDGLEVNINTTVPSTSPNPGLVFIHGDQNWYTGSNPDDLWKSDLTGVNNPCPAGYRVPSETELQAVVNTFTPQTSAGAFASPLKLTVAGFRSHFTGALDTAGNVGARGWYWTSTVRDDNSRYLRTDSGEAVMRNGFRATGLSVRCIKD